MSITYYEISERAARMAHEANSLRAYRDGSATADYRASVDAAVKRAELRKADVAAAHHAEIDALVDAYARKLAAWWNKHFAIESRCPSVMIAGPSNFNTRAKEKQNLARATHANDFDRVQAILGRISAVGRAPIRQEHHHDVRAEGWDFDGGTVVMNAEANRLQLVFDGKPDEDTRAALKGRGFRWSPRSGAWQRQLTNNAVRAARDVLQQRGER